MGTDRSTTRRTLTKPMTGKMSRPGGTGDYEDDLSYRYRRRIGRFLREQRKSSGLTQAAVGQALGIGKSAVSAFELARVSVSPSRYEDYADLFGLSKAEMGKFLLRYSNPWIYAMIYGVRSRELREDLATLRKRGGGDDEDGEYEYDDTEDV